MKKYLLFILLFGFILLLATGCQKRMYEFEYVKLEFNDGSDTTFVNCKGGIDSEVQAWIIVTPDSNKNAYPLSAIKKFDWKYTSEDLERQANEITLGW